MNTLTKTAPGTAVAVAGTATNPWLKAAQEGRHRTIYGSLLKCNRGIWQYGDPPEVLRAGTEMIAAANKAARGWIKWEDGSPAAQRMHEMSSGVALPGRSTLGDLDQEVWPLNAQGQPNDPWQKTYYLPLITKAGVVYTFSTSSKGGESCILDLFDSYGQHILFTPGELPIVKLGSRSYTHKKKNIAVAVPTLAIDRWTDESAISGLLDANAPADDNDDGGFPEHENPGDGMDDEIPF